MAAAAVAVLLAWFRTARRALPWRRDDPERPGRRAPWPSWVAEVMAQQTRVEVAADAFRRFMDRFPTVDAFAAADESEVLAAWSGLGYYRRARALHAAARSVVAERGGVFPRGVDGWRELPGVGAYTAAALASLVDGEAAPAVDGNVRRVAARVLGLELPANHPDLDRAARDWAGALVAAGDDPGAVNEALMELGATVCTPRAPDCGACPLAAGCRARRDGRAAELPLPKPRPAWREVALHAFLAAAPDGGLLLARRREGWNPGFFEPPTVPCDVGAAAVAWNSLGHDGILSESPLGVVRHVITRHRIRVEVHLVRGWPGPGCDPGTVPLTTIARKALALLPADVRAAAP